ncbi:hypothetical protein BKIR_c182_2264 [Candidatus Paraburkholderia kirkii UZHbot1]|uniref:Uncharacterized protein n=1 Tax=Candidatus Paraburkholderia kirkii UZHbot1 TaxID=1055526 RepID=G4M8E5_9BURK|nr:hypothetical protein BKIR_c182_2264 [Candidatus Paraburkholderia kirkii UZHbot1]
MTDDPDKLKGPGGMTLRQIHEQVQKSVQRDREAQAAHNLAAPKGRRQRWVRYVWASQRASLGSRFHARE